MSSYKDTTASMFVLGVPVGMALGWFGEDRLTARLGPRPTHAQRQHVEHEVQLGMGALSIGGFAGYYGCALFPRFLSYARSDAAERVSGGVRLLRWPDHAGAAACLAAGLAVGSIGESFVYGGR
jgi:hypothetical protein